MEGKKCNTAGQSPVEIKCIICFDEPMQLPIFQCPEGHLLCAKCEFKFVDCPLCKVLIPYGRIRNRKVEEFQERRFYCNYREDGCREVFWRKDEAQAHEARCEFRTKEADHRLFMERLRAALVSNQSRLREGSSAVAEPVPSTSAAARAAAAATSFQQQAAAVIDASDSDEPATLENQVLPLQPLDDPSDPMNASEYYLDDVNMDDGAAQEQNAAVIDVPASHDSEDELEPMEDQVEEPEEQLAEDEETDGAESDEPNAQGYKCQVCSYVGTKPSRLEDHLKKHTGARPHKCQYCPYAASQKSSLTRHVKSQHLKVKPYRCPFCTYTTAHNSDLQRHMAAKHRNM